MTITSTTTISNYKIKKLASKSQQNDKKASHTDVSAPSQRDTKCAAAARRVAGQASDRRAGENDKEVDENEANATAGRWNFILFRPLLSFVIFTSAAIRCLPAAHRAAAAHLVPRWLGAPTSVLYC